MINILHRVPPEISDTYTKIY